MEQQINVNPTSNDINLLIKNALLENNVIINKAITDSADKMTVAMNQKTDAYVGQIVDLAKDQGTLEAKVNGMSSKLNNLWAKMIGVGAACTTLGALLVLLLQK